MLFISQSVIDVARIHALMPMQYELYILIGLSDSLIFLYVGACLLHGSLMSRASKKMQFRVAVY
ncbi:hypothetical protein XF_2371 [Xylella fastidiosa 9a5c]|uniref:Uncharacterized protein n=1 Tax=Xylella fastidiosa (strain 9a5c) TaxID=160492 RepID=Q9PAX4_XYLFA|nr:hypothetical protein XF_2371 [Xylella fastidiosa 9a5c]